jgi:hypothetical protein
MPHILLPPAEVRADLSGRRRGRNLPGGHFSASIRYAEIEMLASF